MGSFKARMGELGTQVAETLHPSPMAPDGPLPPLMLGWTLVAGMVDTFAYLQLGRIFVADVTANIIFLGAAVAGAPDFVWWASIVAVVGFMIGSFIAGRLAHMWGQHRGKLLFAAVSLQSLLVAIAAIVDAVSPGSQNLGVLAVLVILLSLGMGIQTATARTLAVPDLTTTVMTRAVAGLAGDAARGHANNVGRRVLSVVSLLLGAFLSAIAIQSQLAPLSLVMALMVLIIITAVAWPAAHSHKPWSLPAA